MTEKGSHDNRKFDSTVYSQTVITSQVLELTRSYHGLIVLCRVGKTTFFIIRHTFPLSGWKVTPNFVEFIFMITTITARHLWHSTLRVLRNALKAAQQRNQYAGLQLNFSLRADVPSKTKNFESLESLGSHWMQPDTAGRRAPMESWVGYRIGHHSRPHER